MPRDVRFWRNVSMIAIAHIAILAALIRWSSAARIVNRPSIVWISAMETAAQMDTAATSAPEAMPTLAESERSASTQTPSKIQLPEPSATPPATPSAKPDATQAPRVSPKPTAKPTPKATPKKIVAAKITPAPSPKKQATPTKHDEPPIAKKNSAPTTHRPAKETDSATDTPKNAAMRAWEFNWYGRMLHDRFHGEWAQPTTAVATGAKITAVVKIRIEKDGRVSNFTIVKPSGNVVVDESVAAVAKRVTQVDPLPNGLTSGDYYEVKINFELNPE